MKVSHSAFSTCYIIGELKLWVKWSIISGLSEENTHNFHGFFGVYHKVA